MARLIMKRLLNWCAIPYSGIKRVKLAFFATIVFAMFAHLFCWLNPLFTHDSLMIVQNDWAHQIAIGRPFQQCYVAIRGELVAPWLIGVLGTLFLSLSNVIIVDVLNIRSRGFVILSCAALATCAPITLCNATYIDWYDIFMLALLLACSAVWLCKEKGLVGAFAAGLLLCFSMGLYQSYVQTAIALVLALCVIGFICEDTRKVWTFGLRSFFATALGGACYLCVQTIAQQISSVSASQAYNSVSSAFSFQGYSPADAISAVWLDPLSYLIFPETHAISFCGAANVTLAALMLLSLVVLCLRFRPPLLRIVLSSITFLLMPLGAGCVNLAAFGNVHSLMIFSYFLFYPFLFAIVDSAKNASRAKQEPRQCFVRTTCVVGLVSLALTGGVVFSDIIYANQVYLIKDLECQALFSSMTRLEADLEKLEGYEPGVTPVVIVGSFSENRTFCEVRSGFPPDVNQPSFIDGEFTKYAVGLGTQTPLYGSGQLKQYFNYILGCPINIASDSTISGLSPGELRALPCFPSDGSILINDGTAIVRLS